MATSDQTASPGETLAEILIDRRMSTFDASHLTGLRPEEIEAVIHGGTAIDDPASGAPREARAARGVLDGSERRERRSMTMTIPKITASTRAYHAALSVLAGVEWRQGRSQPRNVYARTGGEDWKADPMIGQFDTPELAAEAVGAHNAALAVRQAEAS